MKKCLQSVNHDQLQVLKEREEKCNNGETMEAIWARIFKKERKSRYKCVSLCRQVLSWMCQAMFLQSAFQFGFLITVKTLSFFPQVFIRICLTLWKTQIFQFPGFPVDIIKEIKVSALYYGPKYNNFHAKCTAVFVLCFFSKSGGRNNAQYALLFNTLLQITAHNTQKRRKRKERTCMDLHKWPSRRYSRKVTHPILNPNRQGLTWVPLPNRVSRGLLGDTYF